MLLRPGEQIVRSAYVVVDKGAHDPDRRRAGVLYLTTARLVVEARRSRGVVRDLLGGADVELLVDLPLGSLRNVSVRRGRWAAPRLVLEAGGHRSSLDVLEPEAWAAAISEACQRPPTSASGATRTVAPGPTSPEGPRCRYCGGRAEATDRRCPSCGAPL
jgi:hypothetical protein